jgi:hypothetical protein
MAPCAHNGELDHSTELAIPARASQLGTSSQNVPVDVLNVIRSNVKQNHFAHGGVPCIRARALELEAGILWSS